MGRYTDSNILSKEVIKKAKILQGAGLIEEYEEVVDSNTGECFIYLYTRPPFPYSFSGLKECFEWMFNGEVEDIHVTSSMIHQIIIKLRGE